MATSTRESRRRKILERGSDRLAFIMDQVQGLDPHSYDQTDSDPPPPLVLHDQDPPPNFSCQSSAAAAVSPCAHDKACSPVLPKQDPSFDADLSRTGTGEGSISHRGRTSVEPSKDPALDASDEANSLPVPLDDQSSFISTSGVVQRSRQQNFFTPKQISSAIDASEKTRLLCSAIVAVLVLLLHFGFSLLGNRFLGTIISFRPLYFILLTDVTLVILRLLFADGGSSQRAIGEVNKAASTDDYSWAEQLSNTLEVGLVAQKVIDAVFMDCSVYAIIVICGLSFT
ncbi:uncharacterized protein LOC111300427 isoform X2 [Durio zibethinus]|uniref:Uncharacterized protein LOC111300427 isoform X2 n=1 Tax=Durio zibethinus TaxID=66656 RepID=A0A6P5ZG18_DURZI|nr:uncharacterized protein LOC111300427 isoform X2 [Durio zibethinus]